MPDGGTTIIIQGRKRCKIDEITSDDPYFKAKITVLTDEALKDDADFDAMIGSIKDLAGQNHQPVSQPAQRSCHHFKKY